MIKIGEYNLPRNNVLVIAACIGVAAGIINSFLDVDFSIRPALFAWLGSAVITVIFLHEGIHAGAAALCGQKSPVR